MRIITLLPADSSTRDALIEVGPGEPADAEVLAQLYLHDAKILALTANLIATGDLPADVVARLASGETKRIPSQFGFPPLRELRRHKRIYHVHAVVGE